jgi:uncharacterized protein YifE (UPF0438 family)
MTKKEQSFLRECENEKKDEKKKSREWKKARMKKSEKKRIE